jgi:ferredoxin
MPLVVTDNCRLCRFTECVTVCPVSCFHADEEMTYIDNDVCIECHACVAACPVKAIYDVEDLPEHLAAWIRINAERSSSLPGLKVKQEPLPTAAKRRSQLGFG